MKKKLLAFILITAHIELFSQEVVRIKNSIPVTIQNSVQVTIQGGITFENGSQLINNGILNIQHNGIAGTGDFIDNTTGSYNYGSGKIVFSTAGTHQVKTNNTSARIDINGGDIDLGSDINSNKLYLVKGIINTGAFKITVLGTAQLDIEADPANPDFTRSWINGNLRRFILPSVANNYQFPVGNTANSNLAVMDNLNASPLNGVHFIDASVNPKPGSDAGLLVSENGTHYISVSNEAVWHLVPDAIPSNGRFDLQLFFNGFTGLSDNAFAILQRLDASSSAAAWAVPAESLLNVNNGAGRLVSDGFSLRKNIATFGQFGIAQLAGALPVTLSYFDARRSNRQTVHLSWQTQTEQNNNRFEIERRLDSENTFTLRSSVSSKAFLGNSNSPIDYYFDDANAYTEVSYYRLKQVDKDGQEYYSVIKAVKGLSTVSVLFWPNPNHGQFSIRIDGINGMKQANITNVNGQFIKSLVLKNNDAADIGGLAAGTYILTVVDAFGTNEHFTEKIIVIK